MKAVVAVLLFAFLGAASANHHLMGKSIPARTINELYNFRERANRIISGEPAAVGQFPWQVALTIHLTLGSAFCGASLISNNWVLTAAHCAQNAKSFDLRLGAIHRTGSEDGVVTLSSESYIVHENYNGLFIVNDIALIELPQSVQFTDNIQSVPLHSGTPIGENEKLTVSGWGLTQDGGSVSPVLNFVELTTITDQECADVYGSVTISGGVLCCRGNPEHSTCSGDSGGPLVQYNSGAATQVGIVSFGHVDGCASGQPSGYTRVSVYRDWIKTNCGV